MTDTLPDLRPEEFESFFEAVHGHPPFPWQARLLREVAAQGVWPAVLDLPTGTGKTAAIDVAVFHLALEAGRAARRAPLRIVYVVDRRTIVDQAFVRAKKLRDAIGSATGGVLSRVRARLRALGEDGRPLMTALLRGAIARSDQWARSPGQPLIAVSTVDQVGSRLLFRGYGVSDAMKPIHAGLLGNDVLYLLDEVHLSTPFQETLQAVARFRGWAESTATSSLFRQVEMSATPVLSAPEAGQTTCFQLGAADLAHPLLSRRLEVRKPVLRMAEVKPSAFTAECERAVDELVAGCQGAAIGVVVNRVNAAREVYSRISRHLGDSADVVLVTGRMRPLDRERIEREVIPRIASDRVRGPTDRAIVVVATQCIEAGADLDFDGLVTECASLDALRQRFGRLDRTGAFGAARAIVLARTDALKSDPVYGTAYKATWDWLRAQPSCDFGLSALRVPEGEALAALISPRSHAPVLLPAHLDAWVQTSPRPEPDPDVALWLHGPERGVADVQVVWRADLDAADLEAIRVGAGDAEECTARALGVVELVSPASGEAMSVPMAAARRWLAGLPESELADVEGTHEAEEDWRETASRDERLAIVWRGEESEVISHKALRPGDTIVVPASYGGIEAGTWSPNAVETVVDIGDRAVLRQRGRAILRLHPDVMRASVPQPPPLDLDGDVDDREIVEAWLEEVARVELEVDTSRAVALLLAESGQRRRLDVERVTGRGEVEWYLVSGRRRYDAEGGEITTEDDRASFTGVEVSLLKHMHGVGAIALASGRCVGVGVDREVDLELAGNWHDVGKADPRFQRMLHGGSEFRALTAREPLAKSAVAMRGRAARERARDRAGYPRGQRHEVTSLAMLEDVSALRERARDWDLVLHLVASHHGRCRPLAPWVPDPATPPASFTADGVTVVSNGPHTLARLDSGIGDRFWNLVRRYGWWGLAWFETILRLADHRRSELEQTGGEV